MDQEGKHKPISFYWMQRETTSSVSPRGTKHKTGQSIRKQEVALRKVGKTENEEWRWFPELSKSRGLAFLLVLKEHAVSPQFPKINGSDFCVLKYQWLGAVMKWLTTNILPVIQKVVSEHSLWIYCVPTLSRKLWVYWLSLSYIKHLGTTFLYIIASVMFFEKNLI